MKYSPSRPRSVFLTVEIDFHSLHSEQIKHKETLPGGKEKKKKKEI